MSSRQLTQIKTDLLGKDLNSQLLLESSKILSNKDIIATIEDAVKDLEKEEVETVSAKIRATFQNPKPHKDNHSENEDKALKEVEADMSVVSLPADRGPSTVIFNPEYSFEKFMDHIYNGTYQILKKILLPNSKLRH